ncbi:hypothetical protein NM688_g6079 [Phlebia brevispora]|uniref:Uncharacterized protein n=1 Tax=Phlebia brevispora TaxID=194682 RepID=A0ACC1SKA4_9APHY|nr:hypothetical protein NM688_g6079 [Phlebia brevispora]
MKFSRALAASVLVLPCLAAATPLEARQDPTSQCNTGSIQCCSQTESASSESASFLLGLLGIVLEDITALIGLDCSPISVIGVGSGSACTASPVCCSNTAVGGLIGIGCVPISI